MNKFSRLRIRDNWPLLFLIVLVLYAKYAPLNLCLPSYNQQTDTIIDYNALLNEHDAQHSNTITHFIFFALNAIAVGLIFRTKRKLILILSLVIFDLYMGFILFFFP